MMAQWINWPEILSGQEVSKLLKGTTLSRSEVELAAWSEDERDGQHGSSTLTYRNFGKLTYKRQWCQPGSILTGTICHLVK